MKIGLMSETFLPVVDGVGRVVVAYANTLAKMGHEVTVSAPMYDTGHRGGYPFELVDFTAFKVPTTPQYKTGSPTMDTHYKKRMDMIELDLVHAHSPFASGKEALRISRQRCIPLVSTFHSKYYDDFLKATRSEAIAKAMIMNIISFYNKCDEVWAVSKTSAKVLEEYGFKGDIQVVSNGTEQREKRPEIIKRLDSKFGLNDQPVLLFVGQINWKKNIQRILEASAILKQSMPAFNLVLAGQGPDANAIKQKAQALGLGEQLVMTGMISDTNELDALYARADLFVFPSLYDTFSMVIREAAAMDTPSVAVRGSAAAEAIHHLENGYLCEDQSESLAQVLKEALTNPERNAEIGRIAHQTIPVSWEEVMETAVKRYQDLCERFLCKPRLSNKLYQRNAEKEK